MPTSPSKTFSVYSIGFAHRASRHAIALRIPETNDFVVAPEWRKGRATAPIAYVRGATPTIQVTFRRLATTSRTRPKSLAVTVGARGHDGPGVAPRKLVLRFDRHGLSGPHTFRLDSALRNAIGRVHLRWEWHVIQSGSTTFLQQSEHDILLAWKRPVEARYWHSHAEQAAARPGEMARRWMYAPLMEWSCSWAAGRDDARSICDSLIANVSRSKLKYAVSAWTVRDMLKLGGGFCGGWYRMFQALAGSQGVAVERRTFLVDWPVVSSRQVRWCAIVVTNPGVNRAKPVEGPSEYHDANRHPVNSSPVVKLRQRRYRFWGSPGQQADGHCINFLRHEGRYYLYDACFFDRGIALANFRLPKTTSARPLPVSQLGSFKPDYLDQAVAHMLGTVKADGELYACRIPEPGVPGFEKAHTINGLSVRTTLVPVKQTALAFYWRP